MFIFSSWLCLRFGLAAKMRIFMSCDVVGADSATPSGALREAPERHCLGCREGGKTTIRLSSPSPAGNHQFMARSGDSVTVVRR